MAGKKCGLSRSLAPAFFCTQNTLKNLSLGNADFKRILRIIKIVLKMEKTRGRGSGQLNQVK